MALDIEYVKERHAGKWVALVIIILVLAAAGWLAYKWYTTGDLPVSLPVASANSAVDESDVTYDQVNEYNVPAANPRYINIPSINLNSTRVYPVGIDSNNLLEVTTNIHDVAWYEKSGTPGDGGVVLMNGHSAGINSDGAFAKLSDLVKGDRINIERGDGQKFSYTVVENQSMSIDEVNATGMKTMGVSADPTKEGLNLIAFDGKWVPRLNMFDRRVMLRAVIVNDN